MKYFKLLFIIIVLSLIPTSIMVEQPVITVVQTEGIVEKFNKAFGVWIDVRPGPLEGEFLIRVGLGKILLELPFSNTVIINKNSIIEKKEGKQDDQALSVTRG